MKLTINEWIERGKDLPVLSGSIANILSLTDETELHVNKIADVIKRDISLSAAILRITNSSAFGLSKKVTTIDKAVLLLGFKSIRNIALGVGVFNLFPPNEKDVLLKVWKRSIITGLAARELCNLTGNNKNEDAFTIGLLHDIGLIAFYSYDKGKAAVLIDELEKNGRMSLDDEKEYMGLDHVEAGRLLSEHWKLPEDVTLAIIHHHDENGRLAPVNGNNGILLNIIYLGSLVGDIFYLGNKTESIRKLTEGCQRLLSVSAVEVDNLLKNIHPQFTEIAEYFDITVGPGRSYEEILAMVNEEVVNIAITNEAIKHHLTKAFEREKALAAKLEEANRNLKVLASKDPLTGIFNRQFLKELLEKEWTRSQRHGYPLSIIMVDLDDFKRVNDNYGHQAGDMVLKKVAQVLSKNLRKCDSIARYGGEEFIFILPQTGLNGACIAAERFRTSIHDLVISIDKDNVISLSISCGVSTLMHEMEADNIDSLIHRADYALLEAKRAGKDRVVSQ